MKNGKCPGDDKLTTETLKLCRPVLEKKTLVILLNKCLKKASCLKLPRSGSYVIV